MPRQLDQLPPDATSMARRLAALEREVKELRAARRMGAATVGRLRIYSEDGQTLLAELGPTDDGGGGLWTRNIQEAGDIPVSARLVSGRLQFQSLDEHVNEVPAYVAYTSVGDAGSDLTLISGAAKESDWYSVLDLGSVAGGVVPNASVFGFREIDGVGESGPCNLDVRGVLTSMNITYGQVSITPSAANTPTSATVSGLGLTGTTFYGLATASTIVPGTVVTGVSTTNVTADGLTVWVTRTTTAATFVNWMVIGA